MGNQLVTCSDCGKPCWRNPHIKGWTPPESPRCRDCHLTNRRVDPVRLFCACGEQKHAESRQCITCRRSCQIPSGASRPGSSPWNLRAAAAPGLSNKARKRLLRKWLKQHRTCIYCGDPAACIDHVVPLVLGGTNYEGNLAPACQSCNARKSDQLISAWRHRVTLKALRVPIPASRPACVKKVRPEVVMTCWLCNGWATLPSKYCSDACRSELNARKARDRYRARMGKSVDLNEPTKRWKAVVCQ